MRFVIGMVALLATTAASAQTYVHGYTRQNGTYVAPHYRSSPDSTVTNNWSVRPNVNPYTGLEGTRNPYPSYGSNYGSTRSSSSSCLYCSTSNQSQSSTDDDSNN